MSVVSRRNANFNAGKSLEPLSKKRISAVKHDFLLRSVEVL
jgi:hypothetical protein